MLNTFEKSSHACAWVWVHMDCLILQGLSNNMIDDKINTLRYVYLQKPVVDLHWVQTKNGLCSMVGPVEIHKPTCGHVGYHWKHSLDCFTFLKPYCQAKFQFQRLARETIQELEMRECTLKYHVVRRTKSSFFLVFCSVFIYVSLELPCVTKVRLWWISINK